MVSVISKSATEGNTWLKTSVADAIAPKRKLRVLHVFSVLSMGGAETWLMSLLKYFKEHDEELPVSVAFDVLLTGGTKAMFDDEASNLGAKLYYSTFTRRKMVGFAREFRRILTDGNYDALHDHQDYIAGLHFFMGVGHLPPIRVVHVHNPLYHRSSYASDLGRRSANFFGKRLLGRFATNILGTSRQIVTEYGLDGFESRGVSLGAAHCGFDTDEFLGSYAVTHAELCREFGWDDSVKIILFVGRLEAEEISHLGQTMTHKNPAFALDIVRECMAKDERVRFLMVGSGEIKRDEFGAKLREWDLAQRVCLAGIRRDVPRLMLGSDLLLFPSLAEGLGMVAVEAQAAGLRVLASDTTPREAVVNPELVSFASLGAGSQEWASALIRLLELPRLEATNCNELVRRSAFSIENSAKRLLAIYGGRHLS